VKPSPPGRFRNLHLLLDRQKQAEAREENAIRLSAGDLNRARQEMEQNYENQQWKKKHKIQSVLGIRLSPISTYGMVLVFGAVYTWLKYGTIEPFPTNPPRFTITQWFKEP
jgi:hypothetical protein